MQNRPCFREHSVHMFLQKLNPAFRLPVPGVVHHLPANPPEQADSPASLLRDIPAGMALPLPKRLLPERLLLLPGWKRFFRKEFLQLSLYRSEEHTSELQSLMRISYAVFCLKKKNTQTK